MEEQLTNYTGERNLKNLAWCALDYIGKTFADVKWWGLWNEEAWPLDKMEEYLDINIDPMDRITEMLVLVGDTWYIEWVPDHYCFGVYYIPEEPKMKREIPWFWDGGQNEK